MQRAVELFKALGDETRLRILNLLSEREVCVCEMVDILGLGQSKVSRHLATLKHAGLVDCRRDGMWAIYSLSPAGCPLHEHVPDWLEVVKRHSTDRHNDLRALREFSETAALCRRTEHEECPPQAVPRRQPKPCLPALR